MSASELDLLRQTVDLAWSARKAGNHPFGALLVLDDTVILTGHNTVVSGDATGHAETNVVRSASRSIPSERLSSATLFSSTEPCAMCAGAIYWSGIGRVVYAMAESELLAMTGADARNPTLSLPCREVFARGSRQVDVAGPFDLPEARAVHEHFWAPADH